MSEEFWDAVTRLSTMASAIPPERREMSEARNAVRVATPCAHRAAMMAMAHYPNDDEMTRLSPNEIRTKYPRVMCPRCGAMVCKSNIHYTAGDY